MTPDPDHTYSARFRVPRLTWAAYGRVVGNRERSVDLLDHVRRTIAERGTDRDRADLAAGEAELDERHARKGGRPPKEKPTA